MKNIFEPLGLKNIGFFLNQEMKENIMNMAQRYPDGHVEERDHLYRRALTAETPEEQKNIFISGGAGCFAKPTEYCRE